jgi:hypothetical protein
MNKNKFLPKLSEKEIEERLYIRLVFDILAEQLQIYGIELHNKPLQKHMARVYLKNVLDTVTKYNAITKKEALETVGREGVDKIKATSYQFIDILRRMVEFDGEFEVEIIPKKVLVN